MFGFGPKVNVQKIQNELKDNSALLVDVREDQEWESGHAQDAIHLSLDRIVAGEVPTKDTTTKLYMYCRSGGRSGMAATVLEGKGFTVENIGGIGNWRSAGGQIEY